VPQAALAGDSSTLGGTPPSGFGPPIMVGRILNLGTATTPNLAPSGVIADASTGSSTLAPANFVARDLRVALTGPALTGVQTRTFSVVKSGAASILSCTIPSSSPSQSCTDLVNEVSYAPGNNFGVVVAASGSPSATQGVQFGFQVAPE
jgi:hypothetical protein